LLTYRDYAGLPDDGRRYEIHDGVPSVTPAPGTAHQRISGSLFVALYVHVNARDLGEVFSAPTDVILSDTSIVQLDIIFIARDRSNAISARGIEGAPTLAVEIVSPHSCSIDRQRKIELYARHGVPNYWIVDPETRTIESYVLAAGGYVLRARAVDPETFRSEPLPDLEVNLATLWP
jgi:Uma2 family endonuclease